MSMLILALSLFAQAGTKPDETAVNQALETFKTDYKVKDALSRANAIFELAKTPEEKVFIRIGQVLNSQDDKAVRIASAKALGGASAIDAERAARALQHAGIDPDPDRRPRPQPKGYRCGLCDSGSAWKAGGPDRGRDGGEQFQVEGRFHPESRCRGR